MADELPEFGDVALSQNINNDISHILNGLQGDILDLVQAWSPPAKISNGS